jgi:hypothetical protein
MIYDKNLFGDVVPPDYDAKTSDFWQTPARLYPQDCFDPCPANPTFDGLAILWHGNAFVNPPYSQISAWINKALKERSHCKSIVMLLPNWTDRRWFQKIKHLPIQFIQGKVRFLDPKTGRPKYVSRSGSMLVHIK